MSIRYTIKATRPSLSHNFWVETANGTDVLLPGLGVGSTTTIGDFPFLSITYDEFISWADLWDKKDELRPDLKEWLATNYPEISSNSAEWGPGPEFNPLSLVHTINYEFDNISDVIDVAESGAREYIKENILRSENLIEEFLVDADGAPLTEILEKYTFAEK